ncbi:MAG: 2Fe-2S iron-sulfur cluster-binding protein [Thiohalomonadales bacterium]
MSFKITLQPSNHSFYCEAKETILQAALRSGLNLDYSCNSGSCGDCKVMVNFGQSIVLQNADFPLTDAQKSQGYVLLCSIGARSDMEICAVEAKSTNDIPFQKISVKINKILPMADDYYELQLRTPRSNTLRFLAGQSIQLSGENGTLRASVASCPCNGMNLQLHLDGRERNPLTQALIRDSQVRADVRLEGPYGEFTLDDDSTRPIVLVAFAVGFAPIKSVIEHAIALEKEQSVTLFWIMPTSRQHYQYNYCRSWEDAFDGFVYIPLFLEGDTADISAFQKIVQEVLARTPIESEIDLYLAGPVEMVQVFTAEFQQRRTPVERIRALLSNES